MPNDPSKSDDNPGHPVGNAILWTLAELAKLSEVTPADAPEARDLWREHCGPAGKSLLDARVDDE